MEGQGFELLLFLLCLVLSGFYSGSEAALVSISIDRAKQLIESGGTNASALDFLVKRPNAVLTTILVGNNLVNILAASLVTVLANDHFGNEAVAVATGVTTFLILIFGEIIPKTFARKHAETLAVPILRILRANYYALYFVIRPITFCIRTLLGKNARLTGKLVRPEDIEFLLSKAEKERSIDSKQIDLLTSILEFPTIKVKDIMVHRKEVKIIEYNAPFGDIIDTIREHGHSRYPAVRNGSLDDCIGFLHVKDLSYVRGEQRPQFNVANYVKPPFFVYEHMRIQAVFDHMNRKKVHLALVKDENGLVVGIVTLEDIMEEIMGEIHDEHDVEEGQAEVLQEGDLKEGVLVEADFTLRDLYNEYDIKIPLNDNYSTVAGFLLDMLGNTFPEKGQLIIWEGYSFYLEEVEQYEIKMVRITQVDGQHIASHANEGDPELEAAAAASKSS